LVPALHVPYEHAFEVSQAAVPPEVGQGVQLGLPQPKLGSVSETHEPAQSLYPAAQETRVQAPLGSQPAEPFTAGQGPHDVALVQPWAASVGTHAPPQDL
jgi:hypothetical protein